MNIKYRASLMHTHPLWCTSLNGWICFSDNGRGSIQTLINRNPEKPTALTHDWEVVTPDSKVFTCLDKYSDSGLVLYCHRFEDNRLYQISEKMGLGIVQCSKATSICNNQLIWHDVDQRQYYFIRKHDNDALIRAAKDNPELVAPMLARIPEKALCSILIRQAQNKNNSYLSKYKYKDCNSLMLAVACNLELAPHILERIPEKELGTILTQTTKFGYNALMLAVEFHPEAVPLILARIPEKELGTILTQTTKFGYNALMLAVEFHPEAVPLILARIPEKELGTILTQTNSSRNNALMLAAKFHPEAVPYILARIPEKKLGTILTQRNYTEYNALMLAAEFHPEAVPLILARIPEQSLVGILSKTVFSDTNALMLAAQYHPELVAPILARIPEKELGTILTQTNILGYNALMLAAQYHPELVAPILARIPEKELGTILTQRTHLCYNALMLAAQYHPESVAPILECIPENLLGTILNTGVNIIWLFNDDPLRVDGYNAFMLAKRFNPDKTALIKVLSQELMLSQDRLTFKIENYTPADKAKIAELRELQIASELNLFSQKIKVFEGLTNAQEEHSRFKVASRLYTVLNNHFENYLLSSKNSEAARDFIDKFSHALSDKKNEVLYQHRNPFMSCLQRIIRCFSSLYNFLFSKDAFKTNTAKRINRLEQLVSPSSFGLFNTRLNEVKDQNNQGPEQPGPTLI
jgi:flagellar motility protein MotE (MotC chaperone)